MRILVSIYLLLNSIYAFGDDSVDLSFRYFANSSINIESEIGSDMEMYFEGDESALPKNLRGKLPMKIKGKQVSLQKIITGESSKDGSYPMEMIVEKNRSYASFNGSEMVETPRSGKMEGIKIIGKGYSDGSMKYVSSKGADKDFEKIAKSVFDQLGNNNLISAKNIKIGETVSTTIPIQIPINTGSPMQFDMEMIYTLVSIDNNLANFEVTHNAIMSSQMKSAKIDAQVSGEGTMTYDIDKKYSPEFISKMIMNMKIPLQQGGVIKLISISDTKTFTKL